MKFTIDKPFERELHPLYKNEKILTKVLTFNYLSIFKGIKKNNNNKKKIKVKRNITIIIIINKINK